MNHFNNRNIQTGFVLKKTCQNGFFDDYFHFLEFIKSGNFVAVIILLFITPEVISQNNALKFNGLNESVSIPALNLNDNTITIEVWIKPDGTQGAYDGIVLHRFGNNVNGLDINSDVNRIGYVWNNEPATYDWSGGPTYTPGIWQHIALVIEPTKATIYLNGLIGGINNVLHDPAEFNVVTYIGKDNISSRYFKGEIDGVRIWNKALEASEIASLYNNEISNPIDLSTCLVANFQFNEGIGTTTSDATGNLADATLINMDNSNWVTSTTGVGSFAPSSCVELTVAAAVATIPTMSEWGLIILALLLLTLGTLAIKSRQTSLV